MKLLLIDTDLETDCDDAGALALAHRLVGQGRIRLLATVADTASTWTGAAVQAIQRYYGRSELPVGIRPGPDPEPYRAWLAELRQRNFPFYTRELAESAGVRPGGNFFPEAGVALYRRILAGAPDGGVTCCAIGLTGVLAGLLESGPDDWSPLSGRELVAHKVAELVTMSSASEVDGVEEFNWRMDPVAAARVTASWPGRLTVSSPGGEVLTAPGGAGPAAQAYRRWGGNQTGFRRPSWDLLAVLYAAGLAGAYLERVPGGTVRFEPETGAYHWRRGSGDHGFLRPLRPPLELAAWVQSFLD